MDEADCLVCDVAWDTFPGLARERKPGKPGGTGVVPGNQTSHRPHILLCVYLRAVEDDERREGREEGNGGGSSSRSSNRYSVERHKESISKVISTVTLLLASTFQSLFFQFLLGSSSSVPPRHRDKSKFVQVFSLRFIRNDHSLRVENDEACYSPPVPNAIEPSWDENK
ncbi:hypothetical protein DPEC_G00287880 [Dallia pectoralis]|uniref:Uncharacterized protein n=1 Tax=Dallia pectoralis TaxID=75939 RepID=A0ACC2FKD7_DALPE|nr:hypothetical protein DPEC_G00287880 [Dallia pectoralis]